MDTLKQKLNILGLKEYEADVYLAVLYLGKGTITDISRKTSIKRTTVYEYIKKLLDKGLVYKTADKKRTYYCVEEPRKIIRILDQEKKEIEKKQTKVEKIIPELESLFSASFKKPKISFYEGKDGIKKVYEQILNTHKNIYSIFSPESFFKFFTPEENHNLLMSLYNKGGMLYSLVERSNEHNEILNKQEYKKFIKSKKLPEDFKYETDLLVVDDTVALISFKNLIGIIIKDKAIADLQRSFINIIWK
jgi:sugar-specific transcriptional regulator TrmB